ncbi:MAG: ABC transporter permease [Bdellovibrionales bacterium]|nr:ABC transporter permease [Bdellovibrionales bacterium]
MSSFFSWIEKLLGPTSLISFFTLTGLSFFYYKIPFFLVFIFIISSLVCFFIFIIKKNLLLYVLGRILEAFLTLFIVSSLTFLLLRGLPGGPFDQEKNLAPEIQANIEKKYHLDKSLTWQYFYYMKGLSRGYLGESYKYTDRNISDILKDSLPVSIQLGIYALIIAFAVGIPLGVFAARKQNTFFDQSSMLLSISGVSLPSFVIAPIFILFFSFYLGWLEPALWEGTLFYILPSVVLGLRPASIIARLTRSSILDILSHDYVRTARAKGLNETSIFYKHILKNAFLPVLTFSAPLIAGILTGSFIIEKIFAIPGLGQHFINSVTNRDYPLILGTVLIYSSLLILSNLIVDLLYTYFDPRIKLS